MSIAILLSIIEMAAGVLKSQTSSNVDDKIDEGLAIARIVAAGHRAYEMQTGQPLDESLIKEQERLL